MATVMKIQEALTNIDDPEIQISLTEAYMYEHLPKLI